MSRKSLKTAAELEIIREASAISVEILSQIRAAVRVGVAVTDLDKLAGELCEKHGVKPAFNGVPGKVPFPGNMCVCINDVVLHAVPKPGVTIAEGDLVKLDFGIIHKGFYTDHCVTVGVGKVNPEDEKLLKVGKFAVESGLQQALAGNYTGDIGNTIETIAQLSGFDVLKEYVGHAIGKNLHEWPQIPAYGDPHSGDRLEPGMVLCIEAQLVAGDDSVVIEDDSWTIRTRDGKNAVMFEYMIEVQEDGCRVLTDTREWPLIIDTN